MEETWNVDEAKVVLLWPRDLDLENITGESLGQMFDVGTCARKAHVNRSLDIQSAIFTCSSQEHEEGPVVPHPALVQMFLQRTLSWNGRTLQASSSVHHQSSRRV